MDFALTYVTSFDERMVATMTMPTGIETKRRKVSEEQLALTLMLGLREQGFTELDNTHSKLHVAFGNVCKSKSALVKGVLGFVPVEHRLFGVYSAVDDALEEGRRDGVLEVSPRERQRIRFALTEQTARALRSVLWTGDSEKLDELTDSFIDAYKRFVANER